VIDDIFFVDDILSRGVSEMKQEKMSALASEISTLYSSIYYHCHPKFTVNLSHQSIRALQFIHFEGTSNVNNVAVHLQCAPNTASEIVRRLVDKGFLQRQRRKEDERVVELQLTDDGTRILLEQTGLDLDTLPDLLKDLTSEEVESVRRGFQILDQSVRE
jgi:MarR family transcriptional regulator, organic hydroperoxide resistance regulator